MNKNHLIVVLGLVIAGLLVFTIPIIIDRSNVAIAPEIETENQEPAQQDSAQIITIGDAAELVELDEIFAGSEISDNHSVSGQAPGYWFFEASAPYEVLNSNQQTIGQGFVTATDDWMTEDQVNFTGVINYDSSLIGSNNNGTVIFRRDNPSDLPQNDASVEIPVILQ